MFVTAKAVIENYTEISELKTRLITLFYFNFFALRLSVGLFQMRLELLRFS